MLSNAYFLANFRFDTAENEPAKILQKNSKKIATVANPNPLTIRTGRPAPRSAGRGPHGAEPPGKEDAVERVRDRSLARCPHCHTKV